MYLQGFTVTVFKRCWHKQVYSLQNWGEKMLLHCDPKTLCTENAFLIQFRKRILFSSNRIPLFSAGFSSSFILLDAILGYFLKHKLEVGTYYSLTSREVVILVPLVVSFMILLILCRSISQKLLLFRHLLWVWRKNVLYGQLIITRQGLYGSM